MNAREEELAAEIESMSEDERRDFYSLFRFGIERLKAGEAVEDIYRDWENQRKVAAV